MVERVGEVARDEAGALQFLAPQSAMLSRELIRNAEVQA